MLPTTKQSGLSSERQSRKMPTGEAAWARKMLSSHEAEQSSGVELCLEHRGQAQETEASRDSGMMARTSPASGTAELTPAPNVNEASGRKFSRRPTLTLAELPKRVIDCQVCIYASLVRSRSLPSPLVQKFSDPAYPLLKVSARIHRIPFSTLDSVTIARICLT